MKFIKSYKEMTQETYFTYKRAFADIFTADTKNANIQSQQDMMLILMSFGSNPSMLTILACMLITDEPTTIDERMEITKTWNGQEVEDAIQNFYDNFFLSEIENMMLKMVPKEQRQQMKKQISKK